jgi:DNA-binding response OmpR family regulator
MPKRILLVEDEEEMSRILDMILKKAGYEVTLSFNGHDLFKDAGSLPDLILMDKHLPDKNGLDICREIKSNPQTKDIIVIIISASLKNDQEIIDSCADEFIEKPFDIKMLLDLIAGYLDRSGAY